MRILTGIVVFGLVILLSSAFALQASTDKRVAFVVGNSAYEHAVPLANPRNDAIAMSEKLRDLGFVTVDGLDLNAEQFRQKVREFAQLASNADLAIFFYAGHGLAVNGTNYLVPVDAKFEDVTSLDFEAVSVDFVTRQMEYSGGVNLVFLDACRNNPLATNLARSLGNLSRSAAISNGLAEMKIENPGKGLAIAFATSPGEVALDGEGKHSPFTSALLKHIGAENTDITEIMSRVTGEVYNSTKQTQRPWLNTSLTGSVVLNAVAQEPTETSTEVSKPVAQSSPSGRDDLEVEKTVFQMARDSDRIEDYQAYLETYPEGVFARFAENSIKRLEKEAAAQSAADAAKKPAEEQVAALPTFSFNEPSPSGQPQASRTVTPDPNAPLQLTPEQKAMPSNVSTEQFLTADWAKRREVQARLNLAGSNVGSPDGAFGPKTRAGIQNWQVLNGFLPTGYLNQPQYLYLVSTTQQAYTIWAASNPAPVRKTRKASSSTTRRTNKSSGSNSGGGISPGVGAFLGGVATGIIISQ